MHSTRRAHKRQVVAGKWILGIDPAKERHTAILVDPSGDTQGSSFSFKVTAQGFRESLPKLLTGRLPTASPEHVLIAVETACNLWQTIAAFCHGQGYTVLLVNPLTTYHSRPLQDHDFSRTDPKDARLIAENAQKGHFDTYRIFDPGLNALHQLSIARHKLVKDKTRARLRLRSFVELYFPEFLNALDLGTKSALHLLRRHFLPRHFLTLDLPQEAEALRKLSRGNHGSDTLQRLRQWAGESIGLPVDSVLEQVVRQTLYVWLDQLELLQRQLAAIDTQMAERAAKLPEFKLLTSIPNIGNCLAAGLIAECRGLAPGVHPKQLEKFAGLNLRLAESGTYSGQRRISRIGNARLRCVLYQMAVQTCQSVPYVRRRYLQRQLKHPAYRKNVVAAISQLLKLVCALVNEQRPYETRTGEWTEVRKLERKLKPTTNKKPTQRRSVHRLGNPNERPRRRRKAA